MDRYKSFPDTFNSFYVKISKHEVCKFQNLHIRLDFLNSGEIREFRYGIKDFMLFFKYNK